jgi:hypothetical protein
VLVLATRAVVTEIRGLALGVSIILEMIFRRDEHRVMV